MSNLADLELCVKDGPLSWILSLQVVRVQGMLCLNDITAHLDARDLHFSLVWVPIVV